MEKYSDFHSYEAEKKYWEETLDECSNCISLSARQSETDAVNRMHYVIDLEITQKIYDFCQDNELSEFDLFLSVLSIYVSHVTNEKSFYLGTDVFNRKSPEKENMDIAATPTAIKFSVKNIFISDYLKQCQSDIAKALEHNRFTYNDVLEHVRKNGIEKLYDISLNYKNDTITNDVDYDFALAPNGHQTEGMNISIFRTAKNGLEVDYSFIIDLFDESEVSYIHKRILNIISQILSAPKLLINDIDIWLSEERAQILNEFNNTATEYPREKTVVQLFEEQVEKTPESVAVVFEGECLTYAELNEKANALAYKLRELGVKPGDFVALFTERGIEMLAGIYGIIKAGGAYVPIDPIYPEGRVHFMLEDCKPKVVLTYKTRIETGIAVLDLCDPAIWEGVLKNPTNVNKPNDLIYCIYTSGTTGKPKGVMIQNSSVVNYAVNREHSVMKYAYEHEMKSIVSVSNMGFDIFVTETHLALINGFRIFLTSDDDLLDSERFNNILLTYEPEVLQATPSRIKMILSDKSNLSGLQNFKYIMLGGEKVEKSIVNQLCQYTDAIIENVYGPSETTVWSTCCDRIEKNSATSVPIGRPISNTQIYILQDHSLCGIGIPGELCIAGDGLARGYLNRPGLTAEKFIDNPFGEGKLYRSGDLARWLPDGNIEYLGRIDEQVKIRGFRIELGEIESKIREIESIKNCAIIVRADSNDDKEIYAYYTSEESVNVFEIKDKLRKSLPEYMIPTYMTQIDAIPVTRNGKLDKRALPEIEAMTGNAYVASRNETEAIICAVFGEILNANQVSIKDNFFELGGHSLRATRLVNQIEAETGVRIALKEVFLNPTVEKLAVLVTGTDATEYIPIPKAEAKAYYPMSSTQKRTYIIQQMEQEAVTYNMPENLRLVGDIRPEAIENALQKMIDRHEILRTQFMMIDGEPVQKILETVKPEFEYVDQTELPEVELASDFIQPFDLGKAPLFRAKLVNMGEYHLYMIDMHHIVGDGMSMVTFINEFTALYNEKELEPLTHQFKDYSEWIRTRDFSAQKEYWTNQFNDEIPLLDIPLDFIRPQEQSHDGAMTRIETGKELAGKIKILAQKTGTTEYMMFLASAMVLLGKYSRQEDVVIGSPISGRMHKDTEQMLGMFVNTLAMRSKPEAEKTFRSFLDEVKVSSLNAYENQEYPFEELVENVNVTRDMSRNPLFDVMLVLQNNEQPDLCLNGVKSEYAEVSSAVAKFDLTFNIIELNSNFDISLEFCTKLFMLETAEKILEHYVQLLENLTANPDAKLCEIEITSEPEKRQIIEEFNDTVVEYPRAKTVAQLFEEQAKRTPENVAIVFEDKRLTYNELNERANVLARKLRGLGVKPDDFVALLAERSIEMIVGIYATIKAGGAYVPIDPTYPKDRISFMLEDCMPKAVLTYKAEINEEIPVIDLENAEVWEGTAGNLECVNKPEDLAYCIYTSGTTGQPKGVLLEHRGVVSLKYMFENSMKITSEDKVVQFANYIFDASVWEMTMALCNGAALIIVPADIAGMPEEFSAYCTQKEVTVATLPPNFYVQDLVELDLRLLITAGSEATQVLLKKTENQTYINAYGPTETTICASYWLRPENWDYTGAPIGRPISNTQIYMLQGHSLCGIGIPGELCIAGDGLARGYLNKPELTEEKFIDNPFGEGKLYRSGDLARWLPDGNIEYLGRIDEQVKIRGFRIELGEIESRIREVKSIKDCAVIVRADSNGDKAIYAYYTSEEQVGVSEIRNRLSQVLPEYMIPSYMMQINAIPVTRNGKLDKRSLSEIEVMTGKEYIAPQNEKEEIICKIFGEILNIEKVGVKDRFFELGGDSIKAIRIISKLRDAGYTVTVKEIINGRTAENIALSIKTAADEILYEQGDVVGTVKKTPIIKTFEKWDMAKPNHFNQSAIFPVGNAGTDGIKSALTALVIHHDMLRAVYRNNELEILSSEDSKLFDFYEYDYTGMPDADKAAELKCTEIQGSMNLAEGPLVKAILHKINQDRFLVLCIHHLVVDGVSWRILSEDFSVALKNTVSGKKIELPKKTASFKEWSILLSEYGKKLALKENAYWARTVSLVEKGKIQGTFTGNEEEKTTAVSVTFTEEETEKFLKKASAAYEMKVDEILLSGLAMAVGKITGQEKLSVMIENHGREELHRSIAVDRTVGWFTSIYPIMLDCSNDMRKSLITAKEAMRGVNNGGIGYSFARHGQAAAPDIYFNYLGDFSGKESNTALGDSGKKLKYSTGAEISSEDTISAIACISINGSISDGELCFSLTIDTERFSAAFASELAEKFKKCACMAADFCIEAPAEKTASDYGLSGMSILEFEKLIGSFK